MTNYFTLFHFRPFTANDPARLLCKRDTSGEFESGVNKGLGDRGLRDWQWRQIL